VTGRHHGPVTLPATPAPTDQELLARQDELQREADLVAGDLALEELLGRVGRPVRVGSSVLGLMVWRDLDVTVVCDRLDLRAVVLAGADLAGHPRVGRLMFRNDSGPWNEDAGYYPDGLYLGPGYRTAKGQDWKIDIWFVDDPGRQPDLQHIETLPGRLDTERRLAILRIKHAWAGRPEYGQSVRSFDVYSAVLDAGVRDPAGFDAWLAQRSARAITSPPEGSP